MSGSDVERETALPNTETPVFRLDVESSEREQGPGEGLSIVKL